MIQSTTHKTFRDDSDICQRAQRLLQKLSGTCGTFPPSLLKNDVKVLHDGDAVGNGGFAEIFRGVLDGKEVAIKRLRIIGRTQGEVRKVRLQINGPLQH